MNFVLNLIGIIVVLTICWLFSRNRRAVNWKMIVKALLIEFIIAFFVVKIPFGKKIITLISNGLTMLINCGSEGLSFVFGDLYDSSKLSVFIIQSLGNIIFISALVGALYYLGVIGFIVKWVGKAIGKLMGTTEVESFVAVANMFLGHTDSPILVSKYLKYLTESEIFVILVSGMGSISASILGGYQALGIPMEYLLIASAMVPIGSILISKIIYPQTEQIHSITDVKIESKGTNSNVIDALAEGASTGMQIVISIGATLVGFIGAVAVINLFLGLFNLNLEQIFGYLFAPFGFLLGLDGKEVLLEGTLLGNILILNEFIAFGELSTHLGELDARAGMICAISLCGFANLSSMGMCIGSMGVLCPEKRSVISRLVFPAMIGGVFVSILSALLVSIVFLF